MRIAFLLLFASLTAFGQAWTWRDPAFIKQSHPKTASTLGDGLVAYWTFNLANASSITNALDISGNNNTLSGYNINTSSPSTNYVTGKFSEGFYFVTNATLHTDMRLSTFSGHGQPLIAVSLWAYPIAETIDSYILSVGANDVYLNWRTDGSIYGNLYDGAGNKQVFSSPLPLNNWYNIILQNDGSKLWMYTNGVSAHAGVTCGNLSWENNQFTLGVNSAHSFLFFTGIIDDVRVYNRALTTAEIAELQTTP